jgi:hypothetical protein
MSSKKIGKNREIIKEELIEQMDIGLRNVSKLIGKMFGTGVTGLFLNPIAKLIYRIMLSDDIKEKTKNQIDIVLECADLYKNRLNGGSKEPHHDKNKKLDAIVDEYYEEYRENDQSFHHCKKKHEIYPEVEKRMKEVFRSRIEPAKNLLTSQGDTYDELTRHIMGKEEALANVNREFRASTEMLELLKENMDLLDVPNFIRRRIVKIMIEALKVTKGQIYSRIDEIYDGCA